MIAGGEDFVVRLPVEVEDHSGDIRLELSDANPLHDRIIDLDCLPGHSMVRSY